MGQSSAKSVSREEFLQHATELTFDPNTAHNRLSLSEGNRRATVMDTAQSYPDHPDRFSDKCQALSRERLMERCYWEVEWSGNNGLVAVSYVDIQRKGDSDECGFGSNDKSWALYCFSDSYSFWHNSVESEVSGPISSRIGVYLDPGAGTMSFYSVQDQTMTLLHSVQTTFTPSRPLHAGVWLYWSPGHTAHFPKLK